MRRPTARERELLAVITVLYNAVSVARSALKKCEPKEGECLSDELFELLCEEESTLSDWFEGGDAE